MAPLKAGYPTSTPGEPQAGGRVATHKSMVKRGELDGKVSRRAAERDVLRRIITNRAQGPQQLVREPLSGQNGRSQGGTSNAQQLNGKQHLQIPARRRRGSCHHSHAGRHRLRQRRSRGPVDYSYHSYKHAPLPSAPTPAPQDTCVKGQWPTVSQGRPSAFMAGDDGVSFWPTPTAAGLFGPRTLVLTIGW